MRETMAILMFPTTIFQHSVHPQRVSVAEKRKKSPKPPSFIQKECRATKVERAPRVKSQTFLSGECARADLRGGCAPETSTGRNYTQ